MKAILAVLCAGLTTSYAEPGISTGSLLREMTDLSRLAQWPAVPYQTLQSSSYDRASKAPGQPGWFANADWSHFIREEVNGGRTEHVMMEDGGPGAIVRLWCTWFGPMDGKLNHSTNGVMRIYLDGVAEPVISGTLSELFVQQGLVGPPLTETTPADAPENNRAYNLYLPIPYAKGCKVTYESKGKLSTVWNKGEALYYQVNYRKYPASAGVRSFARTDAGQSGGLAGRDGIWVI